MKKLKSIRVRILLGVIVPIVIASTIFGIFLNYTTNSLLNNHVVPRYEESLELMLEKYQSLIDEDLINEAKTDTAIYEQLKSISDEFQNEFELENVYIMSKVDGEEVILVLANADEYLTSLAFTEDQAAALQTEEVIVSDIYEDDYGNHISTFIQIPNTDSVLGLDADADFILGLKKENMFMIFTVLAVIILMVLLVLKQIV